MYIQKLLLILTFVGAALVTQAQNQLDPFEYGVRIGWNTSSLWNGDVQEFYGFKSGLAIGGFAKFRFSRWLALQPELLYSQQGAADNGLTDITNPTPYTIRNNYFIIPLLVKIYPFRRFNIHIGPQLGILVSSKLVSSTIEDIDTRDFFNSGDLSLTYGLEYEFNKGLLIGLRFNSSFTNINDTSSISPLTGIPEQVGNGVMLLSAGWRF
ncbi:MAG: porin family protein [Cyclobacteriaceae bacterium]